MRKTVCKKLKYRAIAIAPETKINVRTKIKRYLTGKTNEDGKRQIVTVQKKTVEYVGGHRAYQAMKRAYKNARRNGACACVGAFLARIPAQGRELTVKAEAREV